MRVMKEIEGLWREGMHAAATKHQRHGIENGRFARIVAADEVDGHPFRQVEIQLPYSTEIPDAEAGEAKLDRHA
jgi:hypothetical protein